MKLKYNALVIHLQTHLQANSHLDNSWDLLGYSSEHPGTSARIGSDWIDVCEGGYYYNNLYRLDYTLTFYDST